MGTKIDPNFVKAARASADATADFVNTLISEVQRLEGEVERLENELENLKEV